MKNVIWTWLVAAALLATCSDDGSSGEPDASADTDSDTDMDSDVDTDTETDTESETDTETETETEECPSIDVCAETPFTADPDTCDSSVDWYGVPDTCPDPPYSPVSKMCRDVIVVAITDDSEEIRLDYSPDCEAESPDDGVFGWRWPGIDAVCEDLNEYDLELCTDLELCPAACQRLWDTTWSAVTVQFGSNAMRP